MSQRKSDPPKSAVWILQNWCPGSTDALTGDLLERFHEGQSPGWFWRQVLIAFLVGASSQLKPHWTEICLAAASTALTRVPLTAWPTLMRWGAGLKWPLNAPFLAFDVTSGAGVVYTVSVLDVMSALMVLPLFAVLSILSRTFGWANLLRVFFICAILFTVGDLAVWGIVSHHFISQAHPTISQSQLRWFNVLRTGWIFAVLLVSSRAARRLPSPSDTTAALAP